MTVSEHVIRTAAGKTWRTRCRCGAKLNFSAEDIATGMPAEHCDFWCSDGNPETGPHDFGVVVYS